MICHYCKEEIADGAIKCGHCESMLSTITPQNTSIDAKPIKKAAESALSLLGGIAQAASGKIASRTSSALGGISNLAVTMQNKNNKTLICPHCNGEIVTIVTVQCVNAWLVIRKVI